MAYVRRNDGGLPTHGGTVGGGYNANKTKTTTAYKPRTDAVKADIARGNMLTQYVKSGRSKAGETSENLAKHKQLRPGVTYADISGGKNSSKRSSSYGGGYGGGGAGGGENYASAPAYTGPSMADLMAQYFQQLQDARNKALADAEAALRSQAQTAADKYRSQWETAQGDYEDLRRQSEVKKYMDRKNTREALANNGILDSGIGRQNLLYDNTQGQNRLNTINVNEQNEKSRLQQAINEIYANMNTQIANNRMSSVNNYLSTISSMLPAIANAYSYSPTSSDYYAAAQQASNAYAPLMQAVMNGIGRVSSTPVVTNNDDGWTLNKRKTKDVYSL